MARLKGETLEGDQALDHLRNYVSWVAQRPTERGISMDLLIALAQATSFSEVPLPALRASVDYWGNYVDRDLQHEFVLDWYAAEPDAFGDYFLAVLQEAASHANDGWIELIFLARSPLPHDSLWRTIIGVLRSDERVREPTEQAIRSMIRYYSETNRDEKRLNDLRSLLGPLQ